MEIINTNKAPSAIWPYSQAIFTNWILFSSGQIALDLDWNMTEKDISKQTTKVCENIWEILKEKKFSYKNIVKTTIFLKNLSDFDLVNEIYWKYFSHKPARSTVEISKLPKDALIEIEFIAVS